MTPLRRRMADYMHLKHFSPRTIKIYLNQVSQFAKYLGKSPEEATLEDVATYLLHLSRELDCCTSCGHVAAISYNSCRNRHCPKCQWSAQQRWIRSRMEELLPAY